jgi:hypothetical protein
MRQHQPGKQAARAGADDHRPRVRSRRRAGDEAVVHVGRAREIAVVCEPLQQRRFVCDLDVQRVGQRDRGPLARIGGAPEHGKAEEILRLDFQPREDGGFERTLLMAERQLQFCQAQHANAPVRRRSIRARTRQHVHQTGRRHGRAWSRSSR